MKLSSGSLVKAEPCDDRARAMSLTDREIEVARYVLAIRKGRGRTADVGRPHRQRAC